MNSKNAPQYLAQLAQQNPQFQQLYGMAMGGANMKQLFEQMARQRGIDPNLVLNKLLS